jgi:acid stress chaperone HdeB
MYYHKIILTAMILVAGLVATANAQTIFDMSSITCKQYLDADPGRKELISSWMRGYFSAANNLTMVDFRYIERNNRVVGGYCKTHTNETLMSAIRKKAR